MDTFSFFRLLPYQKRTLSGPTAHPAYQKRTLSKGYCCVTRPQKVLIGVKQVGTSTRRPALRSHLLCFRQKTGFDGVIHKAYQGWTPCLHIQTPHLSKTVTLFTYPDTLPIPNGHLCYQKRTPKSPQTRMDTCSARAKGI